MRLIYVSWLESSIFNCLLFLCYAKVPLNNFCNEEIIDCNIPMLTEDSGGQDHLNIKLTYLWWVKSRLVSY